MLAAVSAENAGSDIPFPNEFRNWFVVNSMTVTKDSPISDQLGGMHIIYVNSKGLATLKKGGPLPYPDGTIFADDVHEFSTKDGAFLEGNKKAVAVMIKNAKKYPMTGGWGVSSVGRGRCFETTCLLIQPMPSSLASHATLRKRIKTTRSQPTSLEGKTRR